MHTCAAPLNLAGKTPTTMILFECSEEDSVTILKIMVEMIIKLYIVETLCITITHCLHNVQAAICFAASKSMKIGSLIFHVHDGLDSFSGASDLSIRTTCISFQMSFILFNH